MFKTQVLQDLGSAPSGSHILPHFCLCSALVSQADLDIPPAMLLPWGFCVGFVWKVLHPNVPKASSPSFQVLSDGLSVLMPTNVVSLSLLPPHPTLLLGTWQSSDSLDLHIFIISPRRM